MKFPGSDVEADSRLINYENRPRNDMSVSGIRFWVCKNDSDPDVIESC